MYILELLRSAYEVVFGFIILSFSVGIDIIDKSSHCHMYRAQNKV